MGAKVSGVSNQPQRAARSSAAKCGAMQAEGTRDLAQLPQCHESGVTRRVAAVRGGLVGILPASPAASECLSAGRLDPATHAEVLLAALAQGARPPESVTAAGSGGTAAAWGIDASWGVEYGAPRVDAHGAVERPSEALRVGGAIGSCGVRIRPLGPTAGYGKPYVRWCGRALTRSFSRPFAGLGAVVGCNRVALSGNRGFPPAARLCSWMPQLALAVAAGLPAMLPVDSPIFYSRSQPRLGSFEGAVAADWGIE